MQCSSSTNDSETIFWNPWRFFLPGCEKCPYGMLILNRILKFPFADSFFLEMWNNALVRVTVDGGTDRFLEWLDVQKIKNSAEIDLITGDMDSIKKETLAYFEKSKHTKVVPTMDQNETDFTKSLMQLALFIKERNLRLGTVIVIVDTHGRLDHILSNINTLFKANRILPKMNILELSSNSLTWVLGAGKHIIPIPENFRKNNNWCSLLPIGHGCICTTTGLKWNLNKSKLEFGYLVSSSNTFSDSDTVTVETDKPIVWCMCVKYLHSSS